jgi:hypothetical protein
MPEEKYEVMTKGSHKRVALAKSLERAQTKQVRKVSHQESCSVRSLCCNSNIDIDIALRE